jgi:programmed cell death protein 4
MTKFEPKMKNAHLDELDDELEFLANAKNGGPANGHHRRRSHDNIVEEEEEDDFVVVEGGGDANGATTTTATTAAEKKAAIASAAEAGRLIRKAKRFNRSVSISEEGKFGSGSSIRGGPSLRGKNSKKSRTGLGRGLPKKGGAGGKGTWGKLGCELELPWVDHNDPNYESDSDDNNKETKLKTLVPEMSEEDVRKAVEPLILEFFENNDAMEVLFTLQEMLMNLGTNRWMIVSILVELAMDHKPSHREMASTLISDLYQKIISQRDIGKAFDFLMRQLPDLILDTPDAPVVLGNFMARAIADDCIPPKFLRTYKGQVEADEARRALTKAETLLSMKHGLVRLDNVWGVGGGVRPVKYLVKKIVLLLKEYLCSGDIEEATLCLKELEVPHFHHELVYEAVIMVIESMHEKTEEAMCKLLNALFRIFVITIEQMRNGFERVYDFMPEIAIDVPAAYGILERFVTRCRASGFVTDELVRKMPSRGRKRFVSEGDGGRIKENWW